MQLLEQVTMATTSAALDSQDQQGNTDAMGGGGGIAHVITGAWDPSETAFAVLNKETPPDVQSVYVTVAADLVVSQVAEPVRFVVETRCRIHPPGEKYWYYTRKNLCKQYQVGKLSWYINQY